MIRGMYASASGMSAELDKHQVCANNLANINTVGFRGSRVAQRAFVQDLQAAWQVEQPQGGGTILAGGEVDMRQGPLRQSDNPLDMALDGPGLFVIQTPTGPRYTRAGNFQLNIQNQLVTAAGYPVLGEAGPLTIQGLDVQITKQGQIYVDGTPAGRLRIEEPSPDAQLTALGSKLLDVTATAPATQTAVKQGYLEGANVQVMEQLVAMMRGLRTYEANAEALGTQSEALGELIRAVQSGE